MPAKESSDKGAAQETTVVIEERRGPIVVEKKKRKKKYSRGLLRSFQEFESGMTKSARKIVKAVREGLDAYEDARDASAEKKKDGAIKDLLRNQSKALRTALPIAAEAPADLLETIADMKIVRDITDRDDDDDDDDDED